MAATVGGMQKASRRVLVTGAAGSIGRAISPLLESGWDLQLSDVEPHDGAPHHVAALDVTDVDACRTAFSGVDAVVHLAGVPDPEASWEQLLPANVIGTHQVAEAAMDCGVRRLVLASSLQAVSGYPDVRQSRASDAPRPANLYGERRLGQRRWEPGLPRTHRRQLLLCGSVSSPKPRPQATTSVPATSRRG